MFELPHPSTRAALLRGVGQRWYRAHCLEPRGVSSYAAAAAAAGAVLRRRTMRE